MDDAAQRFRRQVRRELGERRGAARRDSIPLRQAAVAYWRAREHRGDELRTVATALGIAPVSLRRWAQDTRFRPVQVVAEADAARPGVVVFIESAGVRIEGLDLDGAAQLVARLR